MAEISTFKTEIQQRYLFFFQKTSPCHVVKDLSKHKMSTLERNPCIFDTLTHIVDLTSTMVLLGRQKDFLKISTC